MKTSGYRCINVATSKEFVITNIAYKMATKDPSDGWAKQNKVLYPVDEEGNKVRTPEQIGKEQLSPEELKELTKIKKQAEKK